MFFILEIMAFEFVSKCANCNGNTCKSWKNKIIVVMETVKLTEYLLSAVNDLTNSLKITNQTNKDFFQFNISQIHGKIR